MMSLYYRDADAALICFDLTSEKTFESVEYWVGEMEKNCNNDSQNYVLAMAGNKCDVDEAKKQVSYAQANELSKSNDMIYYETSAKAGDGVQELFMNLINKIIICKRK